VVGTIPMESCLPDRTADPPAETPLLLELPRFGGLPPGIRRRPAVTAWNTSGVDEETLEQVRAVVASIPPGRVLSYGDVAELAGLRSARLVGRILAEDGADLPWHRVLRSNGTVAEHLRHRQLELLRAEGVLAEGGRVDMRRYRWGGGHPADSGGTG
jgi:methylated-DNA-protein-cysteine methyltransferase related protein